MLLQLNITGYLFIVLALVHIAFPRYFKWKIELGTLSLINRQMLGIHTFFIALSILLMGLLCISSYTDLAETSLGKRVCTGLAIFWTTRLFIQFFGYSSLLWKGKRFETTMHVIFTILWCYFSFVFWYIALI